MLFCAFCHYGLRIHSIGNENDLYVCPQIPVKVKIYTLPLLLCALKEDGVNFLIHMECVILDLFDTARQPEHLKICRTAEITGINYITSIRNPNGKKGGSVRGANPKSC